MSSARDFAPPIIYEVATIGAGQLSVMAKPASSDEFAKLRLLGIDHVVSLLEVDEQSEVGLADEEEFCIKNGMHFTSFPIIDRDVPTSTAEALVLASTLNRDVGNGEHAVIHCRAGVGRAGMIASAVLVQAGYSPEEAIHAVSWARGVLVPDTAEQNIWVQSLEPIDSTCRVAYR